MTKGETIYRIFQKYGLVDDIPRTGSWHLMAIHKIKELPTDQRESILKELPLDWREWYNSLS